MEIAISNHNYSMFQAFWKQTHLWASCHLMELFRLFIQRANWHDGFLYFLNSDVWKDQIFHSLSFEGRTKFVGFLIEFCLKDQDGFYERHLSTMLTSSRHPFALFTIVFLLRTLNPEVIYSYQERLLKKAVKGYSE